MTAANVTVELCPLPECGHPHEPETPCPRCGCRPCLSCGGHGVKGPLEKPCGRCDGGGKE